MFLLLSNTQQNLLLLIKNHNLDTILWISANKVFYIVLYLASKNYKNQAGLYTYFRYL